jgi:hypothetical protein
MFPDLKFLVERVFHFHLLSSRAFDDLRLQSFTVWLQQEQVPSVYRDLNSIADDESLADVAGVPANAFTPGCEDKVADLHRENGPSV